ncbi:MAG: DUF494 domain-containing protein [Steroidobacteraceae bacterium]
MNQNILDVLIYVFDHYMLADGGEVPPRPELVRDLAEAGFAESSVHRALDWLADLAAKGEHGPLQPAGTAIRVFTDGELTRLPTECRGFLLALESRNVLSPPQRELVIERLLALETEELGIEQIKWVVLMVLSSQPNPDLSFARMEYMLLDAPSGTAH